jgi:hypothetical protein
MQMNPVFRRLSDDDLNRWDYCRFVYGSRYLRVLLGIIMAALLVKWVVR